MSTRAMRKLRGDTLDDDLRKIHDNKDDPSKEEDDEAGDGVATGGRGGGARPKQRINPFEMVSECECEEVGRSIPPFHTNLWQEPTNIPTMGGRR